LIAVGAALTLANYLALSMAYARGELSVMYPLSRGAGLLFLPAFGFLVFGERISAIGWAAVALILVALVVTSRSPAMPGQRLRMPSGAVIFALAAGLATAGYTV